MLLLTSFFSSLRCTLLCSLWSCADVVWLVDSYTFSGRRTICALFFVFPSFCDAIAVVCCLQRVRMKIPLDEKFYTIPYADGTKCTKPIRVPLLSSYRVLAWRPMQGSPTS